MAFEFFIGWNWILDESKSKFASYLQVRHKPVQETSAMLPIPQAAQSIDIPLEGHKKYRSCEISIFEGAEAESLFNEPCRVLLVTWKGINPKQRNEIFLAHTADGHLAFGCYFYRKDRGEALRLAKDNIPPYSRRDVDIAPEAIAREMLWGYEVEASLEGAYTEICGTVKQFLAQIPQDEALSRVQIGRVLTLSERAFLFKSLWRVQAVNAYPFLLPLLVTQEEPFEAVLFIIDAGKKYLPLLQNIFKVSVYVLRTLGKAPAVRPASHPEAYFSGLLFDQVVVGALAKIPPEKHPDRDSWPTFIRIKNLVSTLWLTQGDSDLPEADKNRIVLPVLIKHVWLALLRRDRNEFPEQIQHSWLTEVRTIVRQSHPFGGRLLVGNLDGQEIILPSEVWVVVACLLCHPSDLNAAASRWNNRVLASRDEIGSSFPASPLPVPIENDVLLSSGYRLAPIRTVPELVRQSAVARNCLPLYLSEIYSRTSVIFSIQDAGGLLGHVEIKQSYCCDGFEIGAQRATHNDDLPQEIEAALQAPLGEICLRLNASDFSVPSDEELSLAAQAELVIQKAKLSTLSDVAGRMMDRAVRRFKLGSPNNDEHISIEISRLMKCGDLALARKLAVEHGATYSRKAIIQHQHDLESGFDQPSNYPLPHGGDFPTCLVSPFLPLLSSKFHLGDSQAIARLLLGSYSLDFYDKRKVFENYPTLSQFQIDALRDVWIKEFNEFQDIHKEEYRYRRNKHELLKLSAMTLMNTLLLVKWYDINNSDPAHETAQIIFVLKQASRRGLFAQLNSIADSWWKDEPICAYVYRHILPHTHPAWAIGERLTVDKSPIYGTNILARTTAES